MFELLSNLGSSFPWIYRAWLLLSESYRQTMKMRWTAMGKGYAFLDKFMTFLFMFIEVFMVIYFLTRVYELR